MKGDKTLFRIKDFGKMTNPQLEGKTKYNTLNELKASTASGYAVVGDYFYFKLVSGTSPDASFKVSWTGSTTLPLLDTDGDGISDFDESVAGTDPIPNDPIPNNPLLEITEDLNNPPVASFDAATVSSIDEGYSELYVKVNASDPDGDAISVMLKIDGIEIRQENGAPYEWGHATTPNPTETLNLSPGEHIFEATVTDSKGAKTTVSKTITIVDLKIAPIVKIISPSDGAEFNLGEDIVIEATASDEDGTVTKVNFKLDGRYHSQDLTGINGVYTSTYKPTAAGTYVLGARAFDDEGESTEVLITVEVKLITGTSGNVSNEFSAFPNPTTGVVHLSKNLSWELYSAQGIKVSEGKGTEIDLTSREKGMYLLKTDEGVISLIHQ